MSGSIELEEFIDELIKRSREKGYVPKIFIQMRGRYGTVEAMRRLVASKEIQKGFRRLEKLGLLELSVEAAVLRFPDEFTLEDRKAARWRLNKVNADFVLQEDIKVTSRASGFADDITNNPEGRQMRGEADSDLIPPSGSFDENVKMPQVTENVMTHDDEEEIRKAEAPVPTPPSKPSNKQQAGIGLLVLFGLSVGLVSFGMDVLSRLGTVLLVVFGFLGAFFLYWTQASWIEPLKVTLKAILITFTLASGIGVVICLFVSIFLYIASGEGWIWFFSSLCLSICFLVFAGIVSSFEKQ